MYLARVRSGVELGGISMARGWKDGAAISRLVEPVLRYLNFNQCDLGLNFVISDVLSASQAPPDRSVDRRNEDNSFSPPLIADLLGRVATIPIKHTLIVRDNSQ